MRGRTERILPRTLQRVSYHRCPHHISPHSLNDLFVCFLLILMWMWMWMLCRSIDEALELVFVTISRTEVCDFAPIDLLFKAAVLVFELLLLNFCRIVVVVVCSWLKMDASSIQSLKTSRKSTCHHHHHHHHHSKICLRRID